MPSVIFLVHMMSNTPTDPIAAADRNWDLPSLYRDLATAKGQPLTPTEKLHLRGLLSDHSPAAIAQTLNKSTTGVTTDLSATLYRYVKTLTHQTHTKLHHWRDITHLLNQAGYNISSFNTPIPRDLLPLHLIGQVVTLHLDRNHLTLTIDLQSPSKTDPQTTDSTDAIHRIIQNMQAAGMDPQQIAQLTGLSITDLQLPLPDTPPPER